MAVWYSAYENTSVWFGRGRVTIREHEVLKETPCGAWLERGFYNRRWAQRGARKSWAYPTKREAVASLLARRRRQIDILNTKIRHAERTIKECRALLDGGDL